jgi:hypothetical protein
VKFSLRALVVFLLFAGVFTLASDPRLGVLAVVAWLAIEGILWSGVAGFGRGDKTRRA